MFTLSIFLLIQNSYGQPEDEKAIEKNYRVYVKDSKSGQKIPGAKVLLPKSGIEFETDQTGHALLIGLPIDEDIEIWISKFPDYPKKEKYITVTSKGKNSEEVKLDKVSPSTILIYGKAVDSKGRQLPEVQVTVDYGNILKNLKTDEFGDFHIYVDIKDIKNPKISVTYWHENYVELPTLKKELLANEKYLKFNVNMNPKSSATDSTKIEKRFFRETKKQIHSEGYKITALFANSDYIISGNSRGELIVSNIINTNRIDIQISESKLVYDFIGSIVGIEKQEEKNKILIATEKRKSRKDKTMIQYQHLFDLNSMELTFSNEPIKNSERKMHNMIQDLGDHFDPSLSLDHINTMYQRDENYKFFGTDTGTIEIFKKE